ncbi:DUF397 domain-containing protein [Streptomyces sp. TRM64462]|uniref:DUF397 domain-containing protein n=1 Tax=Streptomyces sp. TRM64462 TaxID=2741726 RepID=UPI0020C7ACB0|nr:DUF397 domain-containing protein [Streptomyces sp. TRM64462]
MSAAYWRKSSYSSGGGGECLEVAEGFVGAARWRKSSYSTNGGECLEVADDHPGIVPVRDSKVPDGPVVIVSARAWAPFVAAVTAGTA